MAMPEEASMGRHPMASKCTEYLTILLQVSYSLFPRAAYRVEYVRSVRLHDTIPTGHPTPDNCSLASPALYSLLGFLLRGICNPRASDRVGLT